MIFEGGPAQQPEDVTQLYIKRLSDETYHKGS